MIVEFLGLPGSGKSMIAEAVGLRLRQVDREHRMAKERLGPGVSTPLRYVRKGLLVASSTVSRPIASFHLLRTLRGSQQRDVSQVVHRWVDWLATQGVMRRDEDGVVSILDEGVFQSLWSVGLEGELGTTAESIATHRYSWTFPDMVVVVHAPLEEIDARLQARESRHSRVQSAGSQERRAHLERGRGLIDEALRAASQFGVKGDSIVSVENSAGGSIEEVVIDLTNRILNSGAAG